MKLLKETHIIVYIEQRLAAFYGAIVYPTRIKAKTLTWTQGFVAEKLTVARTTYTANENRTKMPSLNIGNNRENLCKVSTDLRTENIEPHHPEAKVKELIKLF